MHEPLKHDLSYERSMHRLYTLYCSGCFVLKNRCTSGIGFLYEASRPEDGNPIAMRLGVMYVKSRSNPSCW